MEGRLKGVYTNVPYVSFLVKRFVLTARVCPSAVIRRHAALNFPCTRLQKVNSLYGQIQKKLFPSRTHLYKWIIAMLLWLWMRKMLIW